MVMIARTLKQVNNEIQKKFPLLYLVKEFGYFRVCSDDNDTSLMLSGLFTTSIYVCHLNQLTVEEWINEVALILNSDK